jgi:hypothetical protein
VRQSPPRAVGSSCAAPAQRRFGRLVWEDIRASDRDSWRAPRSARSPWPTYAGHSPMKGRAHLQGLAGGCEGGLVECEHPAVRRRHRRAARHHGRLQSTRPASVATTAPAQPTPAVENAQIAPKPRRRPQEGGNAGQWVRARGQSFASLDPPGDGSRPLPTGRQRSRRSRNPGALQQRQRRLQFGFPSFATNSSVSNSPGFTSISSLAFVKGPSFPS